MSADYPGDVIAACCGSTLHLWRPQPGSTSQYVDKALRTEHSVLAAAWNRNNKVVAAAGGSGGIELRYSNGDLMSSLPKGGPAPGARPLTSLAWSMGSKRLAAGSTDGSIYVHDMTTKSYTPLAVGSTPISAVAFHVDDKFLAAAGREVTVFSPHLTRVGDLTTSDASGRTCLAAAAAQPVLAAGSAGGGVAVWDCKTQRTLHEHPDRHPGGTTAAHFAPLDAATLFTAGGEGAVLMQDLRAGPVERPTLRIQAGSGVASLSIREDSSLLAAGTAGGVVLLFDPRAAAAPLHRLRCAAGIGVTGLHWQHNYSSLAARARAAAAVGDAAPAAKPTAAAAAPLPSSARRGGTDYGTSSVTAPPPAGPGRPSIGSTTLSSPAAAGPPAAAPSLLPHLAPPLSLDMSPLPGERGPAAFSPLPELNLRPMQATGAAAAAMTSACPPPAAHSPEASAADSLDGAPAPRPRAPLARPSAAGASSLTSQADPLQGAAPLQEDPGSGAPLGTARWSIKAVTPARPASGSVPAAAAAAAEGGNHGRLPFGAAAPAPTAAAGAAEERPRRTSSAAGKQPLGSPSKAPPVPADAARDAPPPHGLREDILALHLDMLNQFGEQQAATAALVAGVAERQEALAGEVAALRLQLQDLLTRRDEVLWL